MIACHTIINKGKEQWCGMWCWMISVYRKINTRWIVVIIFYFPVFPLKTSPSPVITQCIKNMYTTSVTAEIRHCHLYGMTELLSPTDKAVPSNFSSMSMIPCCERIQQLQWICYFMLCMFSLTDFTELYLNLLLNIFMMFDILIIY